MLSEGAMQPDQTKWGAPIVFPLKKHGSLPFCGGYRKLKAVTKEDVYSISRIDECIDSLGEAAVLSRLDDKNGCWQVQIEKEGQKKIYFTSQHGLYCFVRIPFGLRNAPSTLDRTTDVLGQLIVVYFDDSVVFCRYAAEYIEHVKHARTLLRDGRIILILKKCIFSTEAVEFVGHVIRPRRLEIVSHHNDAIKSRTECYRDEIAPPSPERLQTTRTKLRKNCVYT